MDPELYNRLVAAGDRWVVTLNHAHPVSWDRQAQDREWIQDALTARWPAVDAGMADRVESGPIRIWLAIAPPVRPTTEDLQKVVTEICEQVAPGGSAAVRTMQQEFGPEVAGQVAGDYLEHALAIAAAIPDEVSARLPKDGAANLDHYLYSTPKRVEVDDAA
jgi:hypothetical protein